MSITYTTAKRKRICEFALKYGKLKGFKVGRNWKIARKSIDAYIDEQIEK